MEMNEVYKPFFVKTKISQDSGDSREIVTNYLMNGLKIIFYVPEHLNDFDPILLVDSSCLLADIIAYRNEAEKTLTNFLSQPVEDVNEEDFNQYLINFHNAFTDRIYDPIQLKKSKKYSPIAKEQQKNIVIQSIVSLGILVDSSILRSNQKQLSALNMLQLVDIALLLIKAYNKAKEAKELYLNFVKNRISKEKETIHLIDSITRNDLLRTITQMESLMQDYGTGRC